MAALQTPWYNKTVEALQLNGKGERTQQAYARAVRMLIEFHGKNRYRGCGSPIQRPDDTYLSGLWRDDGLQGRHSAVYDIQ